MAATAQQVKELRDRTGAGVMDCKEALAASQGDVPAAVEYLRKKAWPPPPSAPAARRARASCPPTSTRREARRPGGGELRDRLRGKTDAFQRS